MEDLVKRAALFAKEAHSGAVRKGSGIPYIYHPAETAMYAARMTSDAEVIAAAFLHDTVEDTPVTEEDIRKKFGNRVCCLVMVETEDKSRTWMERKQTTIDHLSAAGRDEKILVLADKLSNIRSTARDMQILGDDIWQRFNDKEKSHHKWYYTGILKGLRSLAQDESCRQLYLEFESYVNMVFDIKEE